MRVYDAMITDAKLFHSDGLTPTSGKTETNTPP